VQMRSDAVVQSSLGCEVEDAFERDDREHRAAVVEPVNKTAVPRTSARRGVRAGEPATSRTSARRSVPVTSLTVLLRADATATTTTHSSPRRVASRGMHLSVTVSIERKV
jgi:hypothetical protein